MSTTYAIRWKKMQPIPQEDSATCWLAAYQMMFDWAGKPKDSIYTLLERTLTASGANDAYRLGLDKADWARVAKAFGMKSAPGKKPFKASELAGYLENGPVLVHGKFGLGVHSIVVTGVTVADWSWQEDEETASYINPYWEGEKKVHARTSSFKTYMKKGVENHNGIAGVLQYW